MEEFDFENPERIKIFESNRIQRNFLLENDDRVENIQNIFHNAREIPSYRIIGRNMRIRGDSSDSSD